MLQAEHFSRSYRVKQITPGDITQVVALCKENAMFYRYCPPFVTEESIAKDMKALPEGKTEKDKYYVGFFDQNQLIAVMDLIDCFPDESTAFIGFFMTSTTIQNRGIGTQIVRELRQYLKSQGYQYIRLGWVKGNPQSEAFWHKNGFSETGVSYQTGDYTVIVAQREL